MTMFKCLKCGTCCRNLLRNFGEWTLGLFLLPNEMNLFPEKHLAPMWGIGLRGRSRPRPETVHVLQLDLNVCPMLTSTNECEIYEKRPQICRAHPLSITLEGNLVISGSVSKQCKGAQKIPNNCQVKLSDYFTEEILHASANLDAYLQIMFRKARELVWLFDLHSKRWKRVTLETVI